MVNVKIECVCGQHYAFEVEPAAGRMPSAIACPACGTDGTAAANAIIAAQLAPRPVSRPQPRPVLKVPGTDHAGPLAPAGVRVNASVLGLVDRETAATEARAKISWGDSRDDVIQYLMLQGYGTEEASELVKTFFKERLAALRAKGIRQIITGIGLICVPVVAGLARVYLISIKLMGAAVGAGLWGGWLVLNGIIILAAPGLEKGDVAE